MAKGKNLDKGSTKKEPEKNLKEKRAEKKAKKDGKKDYQTFIKGAPNFLGAPFYLINFPVDFIFRQPFF